MRNAMTVTVVGWAGTRPREVNGDGVPFTSFRVSSTERRFDNRKQTWADGNTEWFTVKAFRDLALNVARSVRKGDPVVVTGRLRTEEWQAADGTRSSMVIEADTVGHDLSLGRADYVRTVHRSRAADPESAAPVEQGGQVSAAPTDQDEPPAPVTDHLVDAEPDPWATDHAAPAAAVAS